MPKQYTFNATKVSPHVTILTFFTVNGGESESSSVINTSTPKKSWRLSNHFVKSNRTLEGAADPDPPWWSDEDDDEKTDRTASLNNNSGRISCGKNASNSVEDGFESFSCTDEEDEGDQTSLDSTTTSR